MMKVLGAVALTMAGAEKFAGEHDLSGYTYQQYLKDFPEKANSVANVNREQIFNNNMKLIQEQNAKPDKSWFAGVNEFTDWTNAEFKSSRTGSTVPRKSRLGEQHSAPVGGIPTSLDWREKTGIM